MSVIVVCRHRQRRSQIREHPAMQNVLFNDWFILSLLLRPVVFRGQRVAL